MPCWRSFLDGPFAETKELIAGIWIWQVKSMEEALAWVQRCPNPYLADGEIEIRPLLAAEDFAASDPTGEHRAAEARLRERVAQMQSS
jgi:hypothetical protein